MENLIPEQVFFTKGSNEECKFDFLSSLLSKVFGKLLRSNP